MDVLVISNILVVTLFAALVVVCVLFTSVQTSEKKLEIENLKLYGKLNTYKNIELCSF